MLELNKVSTQPREALLKLGKLTLYRYQAQSVKKFTTPLLIIFSLVNRPDILDLTPDRSLISSLLAAGRDVYLLDWGYPDKEDENLSLKDYLLVYLKTCIKTLREKSNKDAIDLLGVCQGGVFSACYAALYPTEIRHLILISTPIDFHRPEDILSRLVQKIDVDNLIKKNGNIPGKLLAQVFTVLKPFHTNAKKYLNYLNRRDDSLWLQQFMLLEKWQLDTPDLAGHAFAQFVKNFYQENALIRNCLVIGQQKVDLKFLNMPILNIMARDDHIVPVLASRALKKYIQSTDYHVKVLAAGHIGIYLSQKTHQRLFKLISSWLDEREFGECHAQESESGLRSINHRVDK